MIDVFKELGDYFRPGYECPECGEMNPSQEELCRYCEHDFNKRAE